MPERPSDEELRREAEQLITPESIASLQARVEPMKIVGQSPIPEGATTVEAERRPIEKPKKFLEYRLSELPFRWFSLAPVYEHCRVGFSLTEEFINSERGAGATVWTYALPFQFMMGVDNWENVIEAVEPKYFDALLAFVSELGFYRGDPETANVVSVHAHALKVTDRSHNEEFELTVFAPRDSEQWVVPWVNPLGCVECRLQLL